MPRILLLLALAGLAFAVVTRAATLRRAVQILFGAMALYVALKLTGVIDALAPARQPWW